MGNGESARQNKSATNKPASGSAGRPPARSGLVTCPQCGFVQAFGNHDCVGCGASLEGVPEDVVRKPLRPPAPRPAAPRAGGARVFPGGGVWARPVDREGWQSLAIGCAVAAACVFVRLLAFLALPITRPLAVIAHEFGHALCAWLFGKPAFPKIDSWWWFQSHNFTIPFPQNPLVLLAIYGLLAATAWRCRRDRPTLVFLGVFTLLHAVATFSTIHMMLVLFMGHGGELLVGAVLLFIAVRGRDQAVAGERPIMASLGWFLILANLRFGWLVIHDPAFRDHYVNGQPNGVNDFLALADMLPRMTMEGVARLLIACCLATPFVVLLLHRYEACWLGRAGRAWAEVRGAFGDLRDLCSGKRA